LSALFSAFGLGDSGSALLVERETAGVIYKNYIIAGLDGRKEGARPRWQTGSYIALPTPAGNYREIDGLWVGADGHDGWLSRNLLSETSGNLRDGGDNF
jgi:hypothetical protein